MDATSKTDSSASMYASGSGPSPQEHRGWIPTLAPTLAPDELIRDYNVTEDPTDPYLPPSDPRGSLPSNMSSTGPLHKQDINESAVGDAPTEESSLSSSEALSYDNSSQYQSKDANQPSISSTKDSKADEKSEKSRNSLEEHKLPIKIACVGDSLTYGFGASSSSHNYPANLQNLLGGKFMVRDYGIDGVTAQKTPHTREGSYWDKKFFRKSHEFLPDIVLIMLGTNDSKENNWNSKKFEADLEDLVHSYKTLDSRPDVYLMTPPRALPTKQCKMMKVERKVLETKIPEIMQRISSKEKTHLIHLTDAFLYDKDHPDTIYKKTDDRYWTYDGIHPNDSGYARLSLKIFHGLNRKSYYGKYIPTRDDEDKLLALMLQHEDDRFDPTLPNPEEERWHRDGTEEDKVEGYPYPNYSVR